MVLLVLFVAESFVIHGLPHFIQLVRICDAQKISFSFETFGAQKTRATFGLGTRK